MWTSWEYLMDNTEVKALKFSFLLTLTCACFGSAPAFLRGMLGIFCPVIVQCDSDPYSLKGAYWLVSPVSLQGGFCSCPPPSAPLARRLSTWNGKHKFLRQHPVSPQPPQALVEDLGASHSLPTATNFTSHK